MTFSKHYSTRETAQTEPVPGKSMQENSAGGFSFTVDKWQQLERFLILGSSGGTYYVSEQKLTIDNATAVRDCLIEAPTRAVYTIRDISLAGRAPKNDYAIFALAMACSESCNPDKLARSFALGVIPEICRIGTDIFMFTEFVEQFRGWGEPLRRGVSSWYEDKDSNALAYQIIKYRERKGVTHRDVLRRCHAKSDDAGILRYATHGMKLDNMTVKRGEVTKEYGSYTLHPLIEAFEKAKTADKQELVKLIIDHRLPFEAIPNGMLDSKEVWEALLLSMPLRAMLRNLSKMTAVELIAPFSDGLKLVTTKLSNRDYIKKSRLHPMHILVGMKAYQQGKGRHLTWTPVSQITDVLDQAFYLAFDNVESTGKNYLLGLDVSGSMSAPISGSQVLSCAEASTAMALVTAKTEANHLINGFSTAFKDLGINSSDTLLSALSKTRNQNFGGTNCSLPMTYAEQRNLPIDTFIIYTDSETWHGHIHPFQALIRYRQKLGRDAKLIVCSMTANQFTIADPNDRGMLDIVGFDTSVPSVISSF